MKKTSYILILIFAVFMAKTSTAQDGEKIKTLRIATYSDVLNLTPQEAKQFWPVFNEYQSKLTQIKQQEKRERNQALKNWSTMTDPEAGQLLDKMVDYEQKELDLRKQYIEEFKKVIPVKKVLLMRKAEMQFKKALLEKIKNPDSE